MGYRGDQDWTPEDLENFKKGIPRAVKPTEAPATGAPATQAAPSPTAPAPAAAPTPPTAVTPTPAPASPGTPDNEIRARQWFVPPEGDTSGWANFQRNYLRPATVWGSQVPGGLVQDLAGVERGIHWAAGKLGDDSPINPLWEDPARLGRAMTPTFATPLNDTERIEAASGRTFGEWAPLMALSRGKLSGAITAGEATLAGGLGGASWQSEPDPNAEVYHSGMTGLQPELAATGRGVGTVLGALHLPFISHAAHVLAYSNPAAGALALAKIGMGWFSGQTMGDLRQPPYGQLQAPVAGWGPGGPFQLGQGMGPSAPAPAAASAAAKQTPDATPRAQPSAPTPQVPLGVGSPDIPPMMAPTPYVRPPGPTIANLLGFPTAQAQPPLNPNLGPVPAGITWTQPTAQNPASTPILPDTRNPLQWAPGGAGL